MGKKRKISLSLILGCILVIAVVILCLVSFLYLPSEPNEMNLSTRFIRPGIQAEYPLGTDNFGRDVLSRIMIGSRMVLLVGIVSVSLGAVVGTLLGAVAGIVKGIVSPVIMRAIDGLMAFPGILLSMMMVTVVGKGSQGAIIAISIFIVPSFARLVYSMILENEGLLFMKAAKSHGLTKPQMLRKHFFPLILPRLITQYSSSISTAIMIETSLSFLGLGIQPPNASWGLMLSESRQYFMQYPYIAVAPGIAIVATVLGFNLLGDGLNDLLIKRRSLD